MKSLRSRIATIGLIVLLIGILIQILYDPISSAKHSLSISNVRAELPQARAKWESLGITDYKFAIQGDARSICQPSAIVEVKHDIVVKVETLNSSPGNSTPQVLPPNQWADPSWGEEVFLCSYAHFTMTRIFHLIDNTLQNYPASIMQARFDPKYGFVTDFSFGIYVGYGLLSPRISDCCNVLHIKNFQPLDSRFKP